MKAERKQTKQGFVPVIVTLESQEEVDMLFVLCNHSVITRTFPVLNGWWNKLTPFRSHSYDALFSRVTSILK